MSEQLQNTIEAAWDDRANLSAGSHPAAVAEAVEHVISELNKGRLRVATQQGVGQWTTHQWIKKAVLLSFRLKDNVIMKAGDLGFTTGPATINGAPAGIFYFTVWTRQADGGWKWIYDGGIDADGASAPGATSAPMVLRPGDARPIKATLAMNQVREAEIALALKARSDLPAAYHAVLAPDARVQGSKAAPATTPAAVDKELATRPKTIAFGPIGGSASKAGDLAWTFGDAGWDGGRGHYVRVWQRRAGHWRIVFDQIVPL